MPSERKTTKVGFNYCSTAQKRDLANFPYFLGGNWKFRQKKAEQADLCKGKQNLSVKKDY